MLCFAANAAGQTFTDQLEKPNSKGATVSVTQSRDIEILVNNVKTIKKNETKANAPATTTTATATTLKPGETKKEAKPEAKTEAKSEAPETKAEAKAEPKPETKPETKPEQKAEAKTEKSTLKDKSTEEETETTSTSTSHKKMMKGGRKITGYRVQAFAGGNKRADREAAERAGKKIKSMYPEEAIYVHFYSPRWICRVGNYRTQTEARQMLRKVKQLGFSQACIVKVKISVAY